MRDIDINISISDNTTVGCEIQHTGVGKLGKEYTTLTWGKLSKYEKIRVIRALALWYFKFLSVYDAEQDTKKD